MDNESPQRAFEELVATLRDINPTIPLDSELLYAVLRPLLVNPDQHEALAKAVLRATRNAGGLEVVRPLLPLMESWFVRALVPKERQLSVALRSMNNKLAGEIERLSSNLASAVQPCFVDIGILPPRSVAADSSWSGTGNNIAEIDVRIGVKPEPGYNIYRASIDIGITSEEEISIIDATPETEFEVAADREATTSTAGKTQLTSKDTTDVSVKGSAGEFLSSIMRASTQRGTLDESSWSGIEKVKQSLHVAKVVTTAVGRRAQWEFYETSSQRPEGTLVCTLRLLVPRQTADTTISVVARVYITNWGPLEVRRERQLTAAWTAA